jgi:hypothetical protein
MGASSSNEFDKLCKLLDHPYDFSNRRFGGYWTYKEGYRTPLEVLKQHNRLLSIYLNISGDLNNSEKCTAWFSYFGYFWDEQNSDALIGLFNIIMKNNENLNTELLYLLLNKLTLLEYMITEKSLNRKDTEFAKEYLTETTKLLEESKNSKCKEFIDQIVEHIKKINLEMQNEQKINSFTDISKNIGNQMEQKINMSKEKLLSLEKFVLENLR